MDLIDELIGSVEFGDWLINEREVEAHRAESKNIQARDAALSRLGALDQARKLLFEFLTLQEEMMRFARLENPVSELESESQYPS